MLLPVIRYSVEVVELAAPGPDHPPVRRIELMDAEHALRRCWSWSLGTKLWFIGKRCCLRARADNLEREAGKDWVRQVAPGIDNRHGARAMSESAST